VFIVHNSHAWAWDNPHAISEHGYEVCFTISVWAEIVGEIVMGLNLLPAQWFHDFLETVLLGLLEDMLCGGDCGFSTTELQFIVGKSGSG
jgi:hypothetical protein